MPGPLDGLFGALQPRALTPEEQAAQDAHAQQVQARDPAWKQWGRRALESGTDALLGLVGVGEDTQANRIGQLAGAALPFGGMAKQWSRTPNLPMDEASRMARAAQQGYTKPMYHGTRAKENFSEFLPADNPLGDFGIHVTPDPKTASIASNADVPYSTQELMQKRFGQVAPSEPVVSHARIMPLQVRMQKTLELPDIGLWESQRHWQERLTDPRTRNTLGLGDFDTRIPTSDQDAARALFALARDFKPNRFGNTQEFKSALKDKLQSMGYDSISYKNYAEGAGEPSYLLLDPRQVKSKFARFDPKAFGKTKDIMAGLAGAAVATPYLMRDK